MQANDAWCAVAELAASQHGAFHRRQAAKFNLSNQRLRTAERKGVIQRAGPAVFTFVSHPMTWRQSLMVQTLIGGVASHRSAAALHHLDGFGTGVIELTITPGSHSSRRECLLHRMSGLQGSNVTTVDGIPTTNVATTLAHLGLTSPREAVEAALDSALRMGFSATWIRQSLAELWRPGPSGAGVLADPLDDPARAGVLPESGFERLLQHILTADHLPTPQLQHEVRAGGSKYRLDMAVPVVRLGIEAHSRRHHFGRQAEDRDHDRDLVLSGLGWEIIYVTWSMLADPARLVSRIEAIYRSRLAQLGLV